MSEPQVTSRLIHGDCLKVMPQLAAQGVKVAFVFADLPYATPRRKTTDCAWDIPVDLNAFWKSVTVFDTAPVVLTATQPFASMVVLSCLQYFRYDIVWCKKRLTGHFNANRAPLRRHEHVLVFCKNAPAYNPQMNQGKPYVRKSGGPAMAFVERQTSKTQRLPTVNTGTRYPSSVLHLHTREIKAIHPTQKPVALLEWLVKTYTNSGDTVLDPVAGSFTTAVACARLGRNCIAIEKDPAYFAIGVARVKAELAASGADAKLVING